MGSRRFALIVIGGFAAAALVAWLGLRPRHSPAPPGEIAGAALPLANPAAAQPPPAAPERPLPTVPPGHVPAPSPAPDDASIPADQLVPDRMDEIAEAWSAVDLDAVRRAMPDNLYFKMSAPTKDEAVIAARQAERAHWNVEYGKVLSGTGSEDEIRNYYDHRAQLSTDYVEFTTYLLDHYRDQLPERDVSLLELARRLHLARIEEIPRQVEEALARKHKQDEARAAWLADQAKFDGGAAAPPADK